MDLIREYLVVLPIEDGLATGELRRKATTLARSIGFNTIQTEEIAIIVNEMVSNVNRHGGGTGVLFINKITRELSKGIELCCCDFGNGIADTYQALQDGYSEGQSLGIGLGAIERLSDEFALNPKVLPEYIQKTLPNYVNLGVCVFSRKWLPAIIENAAHPRIIFGVASRAYPGEIFNGDGYLFTHLNPNVSLVAVIDGLGHGSAAHWAAELAKESIFIGADLPLDVLLYQVHHALKNTRGATIALARLDAAAQRLSFIGTGNIEAALISENRKHTLLSMSGIVGHIIRKARLLIEPFLPGDSVLLFSDGVYSHLVADYLKWQLEPQQIANEMINEFSKTSDDATVLIARYTN